MMSAIVFSYNIALGSRVASTLTAKKRPNGVTGLVGGVLSFGLYHAAG